MGCVIEHLNSVLKSIEAAKHEAGKQAIQYQDDTEKLRKKIRVLEGQREVDERLIKKLQSDVADLRRYKKATNPAAHDEEGEEEEEKDDGRDDRMIEAKLQKLKETYDPEKVDGLFWPEGRLSSRFISSIQHMQRSYNDLYKETASLVRIMSSLRTQVKHHKRRAEQWQRWCAGLSATQVVPAATNPDTGDTTIAQGVHQQDNAHLTSTPTSARTQDLEQEVPSSSAVASTASNSSPVPPASSSSEVGGSRPGIDGGDQQRTMRIKDEPLSPGSLQGPSPAQEIIPTGSQDLDEVGDAVTTPRSRRFAVFEDTVSILQNERPVTTPALQSGERRALQPKDKNLINQFRTPQESAFKRRRTCDSGASAISTVAEDGEDQNYIRATGKVTNIENETPSKGVVRNPDAYRRLDDLLAARPQKQSPALDRPGIHNPVQSATPVSRPGYPVASLLTESPGKVIEHEKAVDGRRVVKRKFQPEPSATPNEPDWEIIVRSVPFRELPVDCLDLSHFKPNPARNQGLDYAFKEVVRGSEQRKCLPGCMRPDCCGEKFRAMVRAQGIKYEAEKHQALLEDHLGKQKNLLKTLSGSQEVLDGLLVEAKARQLANQFGKHRHAYERARSPPGFWRTDMPSTQEQAKDRMEADRMEREKVLERVREAMRPNGLWKFADEI